MSSTTTQTSIANRALQLLGYKAINSILDNDRGAKAINRAYQAVLQNALRSNFWSFAISRAILPASATQPIFGKANYFALPPDFVMLAMPDQNTNYSFGAIPSTPNTNDEYSDWQIENAPGGITSIASNDPAPLHIRYVCNSITEANFDPSFAEAFSALLALEVCEELTQSNTKMATCEKIYDDSIEQAKKRNAIEMKPVRPPVDSYILCRM